MPYYDYKCSKCDNTKEVFHSMSQTQGVECDKCSNTMDKVIGGKIGVFFNGPGFYETDYKQKGK